MDKLRNLLPSLKRQRREQDMEEPKEISYNLQRNGGLVMKDLIAIFGPRYNLPIRSFSLQQLIRATNDFSEKVFSGDYGDYYRGSLEGRRVLVKYSNSSSHHDGWNRLEYVIRDLVVTSQMSHHKNVLPLIGCCLESRVPAMVYDNALDHEFLEEMFINPPQQGKVISWRNRIRIAKDVSGVLIYLHTAFSTPIIFRDLNFSKVVIDRYGVAKLAGFGFSVSLPPGELKVELEILGTCGYIDPEYTASGFVTEKSDVHTLGALMLALLAGKRFAIIECAECGRERPTPEDEDEYSQIDYENRFPFPFTFTIPTLNCRHFIQDHSRIMDPKIFEEEGQIEDQILEHLLALSNLALRCTQTEGENRPEMIDVARQLSQMDKSVRS